MAYYVRILKWSEILNPENFNNESFINVDPNMLHIFNKLTLLKLKLGQNHGGQIIAKLLQASPRKQTYMPQILAGELRKANNTSPKEPCIPR